MHRGITSYTLRLSGCPFAAKFVKPPWELLQSWACPRLRRVPFGVSFSQRSASCKQIRSARSHIPLPFRLSDFLARRFRLEDLPNGGILMLCRMPTIHFFGRGPRLSDSLGQVRIVVFEVMRKGRKGGDKGTFIDWLAVKPLAPIRCFADQNDIGFSADEYGYASLTRTRSSTARIRI